MADSDDGKGFSVGLEVLPWTGWSSTEDELEAEAAGVPWLMSERGLLVLRVEGADCGERDRLVPEQHRVVVAQENRRHVADW